MTRGPPRKAAATTARKIKNRSKDRPYREEGEEGGLKSCPYTKGNREAAQLTGALKWVRFGATMVRGRELRCLAAARCGNRGNSA